MRKLIAGLVLFGCGAWTAHSKQEKTGLIVLPIDVHVTVEVPVSKMKEYTNEIGIKTEYLSQAENDRIISSFCADLNKKLPAPKPCTCTLLF